MADALVVSELRKSYGALQAVAGVSLAVAAGEIFGILGTNGAGKTTVMECVIGLRKCDGGSVRICGIDATVNARQVKQKIGVQLQATALQDKITPREAIGLFASFYTRAANVDDLIEQFSLGEKADAPFDSLSGGQRQRLAVALAFVNEPEVVFLDEPTAGLDAQSRAQLHDMIRRMREGGRTVILTTHYIEEAEALCNRVAIMDRGKIVAMGRPAELTAGGVSRVEFRAAKLVEETVLRGMAGVVEVGRRGEVWLVKTSNVAKTIGELSRRLEGEGNEMTGLRIEQATLNDVFMELTGGEE
jgi:ABC-2 type transport system ATP-binding protein